MSLGYRPGAIVPIFEHAACRDIDADMFFYGTGATAERAKAICRLCADQQACLAYALEREEFGVWGGTDELERRALRKQHGIRMVKSL